MSTTLDNSRCTKLLPPDAHHPSAGRNLMYGAFVVAAYAALSFSGCYPSSPVCDGCTVKSLRWSSKNGPQNPVGKAPRLSVSADGSKIVAALAQGHIYTSEDFGNTWRDRSTSPGLPPGELTWITVVNSSDGRRVTAARQYGHIYTSNDYGETWDDRSLAGGPASGDQIWRWIAASADGKVIHGVTMTEPLGYIYSSLDHGRTWANRSLASDVLAWGDYTQTFGDLSPFMKPPRVPIGRMWKHISTSPDGKYVSAVVRLGHIYSSNDYGATWADISPADGPAAGNVDWYGTYISSDGKTIIGLASAVEVYRIFISYDSGATWTDRTPRVSDEERKKGVGWQYLAGSADCHRLAAVSGRGAVFISTDCGKSWTDHTPSSSPGSYPGRHEWTFITSYADGTKYALITADGKSLYTFELVF